MKEELFQKYRREHPSEEITFDEWLEKKVAECELFWSGLDNRVRKTKLMINWMIDGHLQHGISVDKFADLTPEKIEEIYNVKF